MDTTFVGDTLKGFVFDTGIDLSAATSVAVAVRLPDGTVDEWAAAVSEGTAIRGTIPAGALVRPGEIVAHAVVRFSAGTIHGEPVRIRVLPLFGEA